MTETQKRKILTEARDRLKKSMEEDRENRKLAFEDLEFMGVDGKQWPDAIRQMRESEGRPCITTNKMPIFVDQVVGDQRQNRPSIKVIPVDSKSDPAIAEILGGWIKHVSQVSQADVAIDHGFEHAVACGYGALRVVTEYSTDDSFDQDVYIQKIDNALAVYWGKHSKYDCSDAKYCFIITDMDRDEFRETYDREPMPFNETDSQYVEGWSNDKTVRLAEYFVKEPIEKTIYLLPDGATVDVKPADGIFSRKRKVKTYKIKWYLLSGNDVLDEKEWVGKKYIPVIPIWGKELNVGGKRVVRGLIRNAKDPQRMYNYWQCLSLDTPIPTPDGWTTMNDLAVGGKVFNEKGEVCTIISVSPVLENHDCFNVLFDDGSSIVTDGDHHWTVEERGARKARTFDWKTRTISTSELVPGTHFINVVEPLELPEQDLPIPPYALGVWLGDGTSAEPNFTQCEADMGELSEHLEGCGCALGPIKKSNTSQNRTMLGLRSRFVALRLLFNKHIPAQYLRGSKQQRLELLQGLMDTDGSISARGCCSFTTTDPAIADGFAELLRSLGIKAVHCIRDRKDEARPLFNGKEIKPTKLAYQFSFTAYADMPVFKLSRKAAFLGKAQEERRRTKRYRIKSITPVPSVPVKCIKVDSPSALYLAGRGMIPTHNSCDTELVALAPKSPYLATPKQIGGHEGQWREAHRKNFPYLLVNPDPQAPGLWPKREAPPQVSTAMVEKIQMADQEIRDTMGLQKAALGMQSNERSGKAIMERKKEGDTGTFAFIDNLARSIEHLGRVLVDVAPGILDTERIIRLGLEGGLQRFEAVNVTDPDTGNILNDLSLGAYDVVVTVGPSFSTQRTEGRQALSELIQYYPEAAPLIADKYVGLMDVPGSDELADRLSFLLPPEIKEKKAQEAAKNGGKVAPPPPTPPMPPPPPPDPLFEIKLLEEQKKLEEITIKIEQERLKLEGLRIDNQLKEAAGKESIRQMIEEIIQEDTQTDRTDSGPSGSGAPQE